MHTQKDKICAKLCKVKRIFFPALEKKALLVCGGCAFQTNFYSWHPLIFTIFFCAVSLLLLYIWYLKLFRGHKDRTIQEWCVFKLSSSDWTNVLVKQRLKSRKFALAWRKKKKLNLSFFSWELTFVKIDFPTKYL